MAKAIFNAANNHHRRYKENPMSRPTFYLSKDLKRLNEIFSILTQHGLASILTSLNIRVPFFLRVKSLFIRKTDTPIEKRFRLALEALGPTFIKFGQMLSNRPDILPKEFTTELEQLRNAVTPIGFKLFKKQLQNQLEQPLESVFSSIDSSPIATASLAQVHRATLMTGEQVIIKLQRPNIKKHIATDLRLIEWLIEFILWRKPQLQQFQPRTMLKQLQTALSQELNFKNEVHNAKKFKEMFQDNSQVIIPQFYDSFSTEKLNIQQKINGIPASNKVALQSSGWDLNESAKTLSNAIITMVFSSRIYHPDLHPGNVLILDHGQIALIDFGSLGTVTKIRKSQLLSFLESIITQNENRLAHVLLKWNKKSNVDFDQLLVLSNNFVAKHQSLTINEQGFSVIINDFLIMLHQAEATPPSDLILLLKTLSSLDRLLYDTLDAQFDFFEYIQPLILPEITQQHSPETLVEEAKESVSALTEFREESQLLLKRFNSDLNNGRPFFKLDIPRLQSFIKIFDKLASRLALALITAALIIGTAIINTVDKGRLIFGLPEFGFYTFTSACILGIWVIISILKGSKSPVLDDILSEEHVEQ